MKKMSYKALLCFTVFLISMIAGFGMVSATLNVNYEAIFYNNSTWGPDSLNHTSWWNSTTNYSWSNSTLIKNNDENNGAILRNNSTWEYDYLSNTSWNSTTNYSWSDPTSIKNYSKYYDNYDIKWVIFRNNSTLRT